jgi:hypothetical protein
LKIVLPSSDYHHMSETPWTHTLFGPTTRNNVRYSRAHPHKPDDPQN